jgi:GntR family carbon starvation induced transcriptional regulator
VTDTIARTVPSKYRRKTAPAAVPAKKERVVDESAAEDAGVTSLTQLAWERLRTDIICGKLLPESRLRISKLRELYGIGASPLREALSRLVPDGFVVSMARRGFMVAPISLKEFRELTDLRKMLDNEALQLSLQAGDHHYEAQLIGILYRITKFPASPVNKMSQSMHDWEQLNEEFDAALLGACSSAWLLNFRRTAYHYAKRYVRVCLSAKTIRGLQQYHKPLVEAVLARNVAKAHALLDAQFERTYEAVAASGKL